MDPTGWKDKIVQDLSDEWGTYSQRDAAEESHAYRKSQERLGKTLESIRGQDDPGLIIDIELIILTNERRLYDNSSYMKGSLNTALHEAKVAKFNYAKVLNPKRYIREVNSAYQLPKNRVGKLPYDEARQFFKSHNARLLNIDKSRLDEAEKKVIDERRRNLKAGESTYIVLQHKALGLPPEKD